MKKLRFFLASFGLSAFAAVLCAQTSVGAYRLEVGEAGSESPTEWTDFRIGSPGSEIGGMFLNPSADPVSSGTAVPMQEIGFDFPFGTSTMTHFTLTGDGLVYFSNSATADLHYEGIDANGAADGGASIAASETYDAMSIQPVLSMYGYGYPASVRVGEASSRICYASLDDRLVIRYENVALTDAMYGSVSGSVSFDISLYPDGRIDVEFGTISFSDTWSMFSLDFVFALKDSEGSLYVSDWEGNTSGDMVHLPVGSGPAENAVYSFMLPLACEPPVGLTVRLEPTRMLSASFSGELVAEGDYDGLMVLLSETEDIEGGPVDQTAYAVGDQLAGGEVLVYGTDTSLEIDGLQPATDYFLAVWPYNDLCAGGPLYGEPVFLDFATSTVPPVVTLLETGTNSARIGIAGEGENVLVGMARQDYQTPGHFLDVSGRSCAIGDTLSYSLQPVADHSEPWMMQVVYNGPVAEDGILIENLPEGEPCYLYFYTWEDGRTLAEYSALSLHTVGTAPMTFDFRNDREPDAEEDGLPAGWSCSEGLSTVFAAGYPNLGTGSASYVPDDFRALTAILEDDGQGMATGDMITPCFAPGYSSLDVFFQIQMARASGWTFVQSDLSGTDTVSVWYREEGAQQWTLVGIETGITLDYEDGFATLRMNIPEVDAESRMQLRFLYEGESVGARFSLHSVTVEPALPCAYPVNIVQDAMAITHRAVALTWENEDRLASTLFRYREAGTEDWSAWSVAENTTRCDIIPLASNTLYEVALRNACPGGDSSLVRVAEVSTLRALPFEQSFTDLEALPEDFQACQGDFGGNVPVEFSTGSAGANFQAGCFSQEGHTSVGVPMNGGTRWLLFPGICLEDQEAPAELRFLYKAYYDRTGVQEETDGRTRARMLLVASQDGNFSEENILDTIPVGECTMDYQEYVLDLSRWTRQLYFALVMDNQELSLGVDPYVWFVLDSVDIRYTEGTPCLAVEDIDQYDLSAYGITLSWTGYSSEYGIYYTDQAAGETDTVYTDRTEYVLDGLNPGTLYTYRIQSFCEPGHRSPGPLSEEGFFTTANICAVPSDFRVIATSWRSVTITAHSESNKWVHIWEEESELPDVYRLLGSVDTVEIYGVDYGKDYFIALRAVCSAGDSSLWTDTLAFTTPMPNCNPPTDLKAEPSSTTASLSWTPSDNNDYFWLMWRSLDENVFDTVDVYIYSYNLSGLNPNTAYTWTLQALCDDNSLISAPVSSEFETTPMGNETEGTGSLKLGVAGKRIMLYNPGRLEIDKVDVFTSDGRLLYTDEIHASGDVALPVLDYEGMVLVRVVSGQESKVFKTLLVL